MERYCHLQALPNSPLSPLTPLSENTKFEFNLGGDGSLDKYINSVRHEHRVEKQQQKLLQQANRSYPKKSCPLEPKHYSDDFLKIRDLFEGHGAKHNCFQKCAQNKQQLQDAYSVTPKAPVVTITGTTPTSKNQALNIKVVKPLQPKNLNSKPFNPQQKHKHLQPIQNRVFRQASPVAAKPLCSRVARILQQNGLFSMYSALFQMEEIDYIAFQWLKLHDLHQLGITNPEHCSTLMDSISYAGQLF